MLPPPRAMTEPVETAGDGTFFATSIALAGGQFELHLGQLFQGEACRTHFPVPDEDCLDDYGVEYSDVVATVRPDDVAVVTVLDGRDAPSTRFQITGEDLAVLLEGGSPAGAPAGFVMVSFPLVVTRSGGVVTRIDQYFIP
ncbi:MAG: hypothetical protein ACK5OX_14685 [Desertimonas sp.]